MTDDLVIFIGTTFLFLLGIANVLLGNIYLVLWLFAPDHILLPCWHWTGALFNLFGGAYWTWKVWTDEDGLEYGEQVLDLIEAIGALWDDYSTKYRRSPATVKCERMHL